MKEKSIKWLKFATDDFEVGQATLEMFGDKYIGIVAYHFQQAAEKSFKAFLIFNGQIIPKSHNLNLLAEQCELLDSDFKSIRLEANHLNPFSIKTRYPDDIAIHLTYQEAQELLCYSKEIITLVKNKIF